MKLWKGCFLLMASCSGSRMSQRLLILAQYLCHAARTAEVRDGHRGKWQNPARRRVVRKRYAPWKGWTR